MNRDEVIALAQQAGWEMPTEWDADDGFLMRLGRFAALVAAAEREACARMCEQYAEHQQQWRNESAEFRAMGANEAAEEIRARGNDE